MAGAHTDIARHVRLYLLVFALLAIGTVVTVLAAQIDLGRGTNIGVALLIAAAKASLVAGVFMHLRWEKAPSIWWLLALCGIFFLALLFLPLLTVLDQPPHVHNGSWG